MNFSKGILESRKQHYKHLAKLLVSSPLRSNIHKCWTPRSVQFHWTRPRRLNWLLDCGSESPFSMPITARALWCSSSKEMARQFCIRVIFAVSSVHCIYMLFDGGCLLHVLKWQTCNSTSNVSSWDLVGEQPYQEPCPHPIYTWTKTTRQDLSWHYFRRQTRYLPWLSIESWRYKGASGESPGLSGWYNLLFSSMDLWLRRRLANSVCGFEFQSTF